MNGQIPYARGCPLLKIDHRTREGGIEAYAALALAACKRNGEREFKEVQSRVGSLEYVKGALRVGSMNAANFSADRQLARCDREAGVHLDEGQ